MWSYERFENDSRTPGKQRQLSYKGLKVWSEEVGGVGGSRWESLFYPPADTVSPFQRGWYFSPVLFHCTTVVCAHTCLSGFVVSTKHMLNRSEQVTLVHRIQFIRADNRSLSLNFTALYDATFPLLCLYKLWFEHSEAFDKAGKDQSSGSQTTVQNACERLNTVLQFLNSNNLRKGLPSQLQVFCFISDGRWSIYLSLPSFVNQWKFRSLHNFPFIGACEIS